MTFSLNHMRIGTRLRLAFALILLLLGGIVLVSIRDMRQTGANTDDIINRAWVRADAAAVINGTTRANARRTMELFFVSNAEERSRILGFIDQNKTTITNALNDLDKLVEADADKAVLAELKAARGRYVASFTRVAQQLAEGQRDVAAQTLKTETLPAIDVLQGHVDALNALQRRHAHDNGTAVQSQISAAIRWVIGLGLVCLATGVLLAWRITHSIVGPVSAAAASADLIARGDLSHAVAVHGQDETGQMLHSIATMQQGLRELVMSVRAGIGQVSVASAEIATANNDLSTRTESQASALQETAASMEELSGTVRHNADSAREGNLLATEASDMAARGGAVVEQVVATMRSINDSSTQIADIIGVIDGIAFQTNILALNAAVEAARAGEQGRGFAVVASEVRSLAQRSADAAKQIKALITESVQRVERGSLLVDKAGASMTGTVQAIQRAAGIMGQISAASHEQSAAVSQVGGAVSQLDQTTQQNAALVEQTAAAAASLNDQAQQLVVAVSRFRLEASA